MKRRRFQAWYFLAALLLVGAVLFFRPDQVFERNPPDWNSSNPIDQIGTPSALPPASSTESALSTAIPTKPAPPPPRRLSEAEITKLRSQAKIGLAANYAAQKSFFAEYGRYTTDLYAVGWMPEENPLPYKAGFLQPAQPANLPANEDPRRLDTDALLRDPESPARSGRLYTPSAEAISLADLSGYCKLGCTASERSFELLVAFNLDDDATLDVWRITDKKELEQVVDDTKN